MVPRTAWMRRSIEDWLTAFKIYALALVKLDAALDEMQ